MYQLICKDEVNSENNFTEAFNDRLAILNEIARLYGREVVEEFMEVILDRSPVKLDITNYGKVQFQMK
jgi:CRISPR/Cas system CSM-associated protein Csm4 (group 5 of RAMP superfamily)